MKNLYVKLAVIALLFGQMAFSQGLRIPGNTNFPSSAGRSVGATNIEIKWNAPGVKGREGKIWGTDVAPYGYTVLGYGSDMESPWRAGADENTTISFSTDVKINDQNLPAGTYGLHMALYADSTVLIFNKNTEGWGSYFYDKTLDMLRVSTRQQKNQTPTVERLNYIFENQTPTSVDVALVWENWKIPFTVTVDSKANTLAYLKTQMTGALGFDPPSLLAAADWCLRNDLNYEQALNWVNAAVDPRLGGLSNFSSMSIKAKLLEKLNRNTEADALMKQAISNASVMELHSYGRQLLSENKIDEAFSIFEKNYKTNHGAWPTNVGMMRAYSAKGNLKKAIVHAKDALNQAPDEPNKNAIANAIKTLESGAAL